MTLEEAQDLGCRACASPGGGCQFLGTAATSQVVGEALGMSLGHSALAPSGHPIWLDMARRSAAALMALEQRQITTRDIVTDAAIRNAMVVFAAFGGSTNLILHLPAIAHAAGLRRPIAADWAEVNRQVPRLVDALPNGPKNHPTVQVFLAGGVPEVMLHLRRLELLDTSVMTAAGMTLDAQLDAWEASERRTKLRAQLQREGVNPEDVIVSPDNARRLGLTSTVCFPDGNIAPEGSVIKSTAIDPSVVDADGVYRLTGSAKVFLSEPAAMAAIKSNQIARATSSCSSAVVRWEPAWRRCTRSRAHCGTCHLANMSRSSLTHDSAASRRAHASGTFHPRRSLAGPSGNSATAT